MGRARLGVGEPGGTTIFNADELRDIGVRMIDEFGDYHRVFWNCQTFAKCYEGHHLGALFLRPVLPIFLVIDDRLTTLDALGLFLCAFAVPIPLTTTVKFLESRRVEELVSVCGGGISLIARADDVEAEAEAEDPSIYDLSRMAMSLIGGAVHSDPTVRTRREGDCARSISDRFFGMFNRFP